VFSKACGVVQNFTKPVIVTTRTADGIVDSGCATFLVVNSDGWIVTAAHVLNAMHAAKQHAKEKSEHETNIATIKSDNSLSVRNRNRKLEHYKANPKWITQQSFWWWRDGVWAKEFRIDPQADIAIAKLEGFDTSIISCFPTFKKPNTDPSPGGSLCRLGFPFATVTSTFDEATQQFKTQLGNLAMFPNDGIHTRMVVTIDQGTKRQVKFIETSTPGLKGQSGGPLFDTEGHIWGIQTSTDHLELGFTPKILKDKKVLEVKEYQFMHVGRCTHVQHVVNLFNLAGVQYASE